jgi:hypothetical protein
VRQKIFSEVDAERQHQESKWGNAFDDRNTPYNWSAYIGQYSTRHLIGDPTKVSEAEFRADMVKVAALAVAAVESIDRRKP